MLAGAVQLAANANFLTFDFFGAGGVGAAAASAGNHPCACRRLGRCPLCVFVCLPHLPACLHPALPACRATHAGFFTMHEAPPADDGGGGADLAQAAGLVLQAGGALQVRGPSEWQLGQLGRCQLPCWQPLTAWCTAGLHLAWLAASCRQTLCLHAPATVNRPPSAVAPARCLRRDALQKTPSLGADDAERACKDALRAGVSIAAAGAAWLALPKELRPPPFRPLAFLSAACPHLPQRLCPPCALHSARCMPQRRRPLLVS